MPSARRWAYWATGPMMTQKLQWTPLPDSVAGSVAMAKDIYRRLGRAFGPDMLICSGRHLDGSGGRWNLARPGKGKIKPTEIFDAINAESWAAGELTVSELVAVLRGIVTPETGITAGNRVPDWSYSLAVIDHQSANTYRVIIRRDDDELTTDEPEIGNNPTLASTEDDTQLTQWLYRLIGDDGTLVSEFVAGPERDITVTQNVTLEVTDERRESGLMSVNLQWTDDTAIETTQPPKVYLTRDTLEGGVKTRVFTLSIDVPDTRNGRPILYTIGYEFPPALPVSGAGFGTEASSGLRWTPGAIAANKVPGIQTEYRLQAGQGIRVVYSIYWGRNDKTIAEIINPDAPDGYTIFAGGAPVTRLRFDLYFNDDHEVKEPDPPRADSDLLTQLVSILLVALAALLALLLLPDLLALVGIGTVAAAVEAAAVPVAVEAAAVGGAAGAAVEAEAYAIVAEIQAVYGGAAAATATATAAGAAAAIENFDGVRASAQAALEAGAEILLRNGGG